MSGHVIDIIPVRHPDGHTEIEVDADTAEEALEKALAVMRGRMRNVRIAGDYHGPGYGTPGYPSFEGFSSVEQAAGRFRERQQTSGSWRLDSTELTVSNQTGYITSVTPEISCWPATSSEDELELYRVYIQGGHRMIAREPFMRLKAGPRGGVVKERY